MISHNIEKYVYKKGDVAVINTATTNYIYPCGTITKWQWLRVANSLLTVPIGLKSLRFCYLLKRLCRYSAQRSCAQLNHAGFKWILQTPLRPTMTMHCCCKVVTTPFYRNIKIISIKFCKYVDDEIRPFDFTNFIIWFHKSAIALPRRPWYKFNFCLRPLFREFLNVDNYFGIDKF